ncbi:hypothetical protein niasHS_009680 [Heterodera schachtii]|uniref:Uncharacterized protein n=1 Tax=Heterodera schachtii TaxID=97005 RepID=A0ABD2J0X7_HETSC
MNPTIFLMFTVGFLAHFSQGMQQQKQEKRLIGSKNAKINQKIEKELEKSKTDQIFARNAMARPQQMQAVKLRKIYFKKCVEQLEIVAYRKSDGTEIFKGITEEENDSISYKGKQFLVINDVLNGCVNSELIDSDQQIAFKNGATEFGSATLETLKLINDHSPNPHASSDEMDFSNGFKKYFVDRAHAEPSIKYEDENGDIHEHRFC